MCGKQIQWIHMHPHTHWWIKTHILSLFDFFLYLLRLHIYSWTQVCNCKFSIQISEIKQNKLKQFFFNEFVFLDMFNFILLTVIQQSGHCGLHVQTLGAEVPLYWTVASFQPWPWFPVTSKSAGPGFTSGEKKRILKHWNVTLDPILTHAHHLLPVMVWTLIFMVVLVP